ncbi:MAG: MarR family winged helix-turn-helix transcriptional regulator [Anaerolineaceae bacterium]|jgi:DNA-binding MarR family transcriptional regulator|nr:MAG: hypothetical protein CVU46_05460 [Chloroflexi bacterium HGW-Chloroflexi-8]
MNESEKIMASIHEFAGIFSRLSVLQMKKIMDENSLSNSQIISLMHMNRQGPCGISQIASQLGKTDAASSQMVQRLVEMGLVERAESLQDRRAKQISLTVKGKKLVDQMVENRRGLIEAIVDNLPLEKREATIEAITLLVGSAREYEKSHYENTKKT